LIYKAKWHCGITSCTQRDTWNFPLRNISCTALFGSRRNQRRNRGSYCIYPCRKQHCVWL